MTLRIVYSFMFIARWQDSNRLPASKSDERVSPWSIVPSVPVLVALACALVGGLLSANHAPNAFVHIAVGGALFCCVALTAFVFWCRKADTQAPARHPTTTRHKNCTGGERSGREWAWQTSSASSRKSDTHSAEGRWKTAAAEGLACNEEQREQAPDKKKK